MFKSIIVSATPGLGKTYVFNKSRELGLSILDSDYSSFSKTSEGLPNPEFPQNYIDYIRKELPTADLILVSAHPTVRDALKENKMPYYLFYPDLESTNKELFLEMLLNGGSSEDFVKLVSDNWIDWNISCRDDEFATKVPIVNAHNNHLINYIVTMFEKEDLLIQSKYILDRKVAAVHEITFNIKYDDGGYVVETVKEGEDVTVSINKDGIVNTYTGRIKYIRPFINSYELSIDASSEYNSQCIITTSNNIVWICKGKREKIAIPDLPVIKEEIPPETEGTGEETTVEEV